MYEFSHYLYTGGSANPFQWTGPTVSSATAMVGSTAGHPPVTWTGDGYHGHQYAPSAIVSVAPTATPVHEVSRLEVATLDGAVAVIAALAVGVAIVRLARAAFSIVSRPGRVIRARLARTTHGPAP